MNEVDVSVIIPLYRADERLPDVLAALRPQVHDRAEVLIVDSSGLGHAEALQRAYRWVRVIGRAERTLPGAARNIGTSAARGRRLAFLDADAVPAPGWLAGLEGALGRSAAAAAAGAVRNPHPRDPIRTAAYLLEFSDWSPARRGRLAHGATCNLLVDRAAFEAAGGFREDLWPGEDTLLTTPWAQADRLAFARDAAVWHHCRAGLVGLIRHQQRLGRAFAVMCREPDYPLQQFGRFPLILSAPPLRLLAVILRVRHDRGLLARSLLLAPLLLVGLFAWTAGVIAGTRDHTA